MLLLKLKTDGKLKNALKVSPDIYGIIQILCMAIKERRLQYFYYESKKRKAWREIRPYMIIPNDKGNLELVGLPTEELNKGRKQAGHYLLDELDVKQFKVLDETFDDPGVSREIVVVTINPVVCRFICDNEDPKKVVKSWIKISKDIKSLNK